MADLLFVYGTLGSAYDNEYARLLRANAEFLGPAVARGSLVRRNGYPAFIPGETGEVPGELYRIKDPSSVIRRLDEYEGDGYERISISVNGAAAWVYALRES